MLQTYQNIESLIKLGPWLYCTDSDSIIDYYLCRTCNNHLTANIKSFYGGGIHNRLHLDENALQDAMQKLSPDQRRVIVLKIINGFSNQEVADILSKSIGAVKTIQNRALIILRHLLFSDYDLLFHNQCLTEL